ncbi:hypothetical protein D0Z07_3187 [Hyphodiscus hymeniophilus]|uniref:Beta-lactamase-related domain-containing protein n=1 Tax=Hyphodiscus hymeniophilus TaxID=353542 RepID=A0A9P7AYQ2_9HELO|nr:hypothetical protein D0Z07_3187 [Hyphodiscus hymeniophilus]
MTGRYLDSDFQRFEKSICEIHKISKTDLITIHIQQPEESFFATYQLTDDDKSIRIADFDDHRVFAVASLFKPLIATGLALIIEKLSISPEEKHQRFHCLKEAWGKSFTLIFNSLEPKFRIKRLEGDPHVKQLLCHFRGVYNMNHILLAPDGSPLLSEEDFLAVVSQFTKDTRTKHDRGAWVSYSNSNFILLALLIEAVSKMSIQEFLKEYVFVPLEMNHTCTTIDELHGLPDGLLAKPHAVSGSGLRTTISLDRHPYLANTVEFALAGGYTTAGDYGRFQRALIRGFYEPGSSLLDHKVSKFLVEILSEVVEEQPNGYAACGFLTMLHEPWAGSHSLNSLVSPYSKCKDWVLGKSVGEEEIRAHYAAGSATGWASTAYLVLEQSFSIVVLTNSSGPLDSTDRITQLCLAELLELWPARYDKGKLALDCLSPKSTPRRERTQAHHVELSRLLYKENAAKFKQLEEEDSPQSTTNTGCPNVCGAFECRNTRQSLQIWLVDSMLHVRMIGSKGKESGLMRDGLDCVDRFARVSSESTGFD